MKRSTMTVTLVLTAVLFCGIAVAQEQKPAAEPPVEMGAPTEMQQMAFMIGIWDVTMQYRTAPEAAWMQAAAINTNNMILDGCVLESVLEGQIGGMQMEGIGMTTYNRGLQMWQMMFADNSGMGISLYVGGFADGKWIFGGQDVFPSGDTVLTRITSYNITDTKYDWMMENSLDGGQTWYTSLEATYTKRQ